MLFFVHGVDAPNVDDQLDLLGEQHWSYMDTFAHRLVARGPTLSPDGERHTGSVHVVEAADLAAARRFADEEPYAKAGLYSVCLFADALGGSMWDPPAASSDLASAIAFVSTPPHRVSPSDHLAPWRAATATMPLDGIVFGGLLLSGDGRDTTGLVLALDHDLPMTERIVASPNASRVGRSIVVERWRRGGRPHPVESPV